jgi:hypothetical protein
MREVLFKSQHIIITTNLLSKDTTNSQGNTAKQFHKILIVCHAC